MKRFLRPPSSIPCLLYSLSTGTRCAYPCRPWIRRRMERSERRDRSEIPQDAQEHPHGARTLWSPGNSMPSGERFPEPRHSEAADPSGEEKPDLLSLWTLRSRGMILAGPGCGKRRKVRRGESGQAVAPGSLQRQGKAGAWWRKVPEPGRQRAGWSESGLASGRGSRAG